MWNLWMLYQPINVAVQIPKKYIILLNVFKCFKKCINGATTLYLMLNSLYYIKNQFTEFLNIYFCKCIIATQQEYKWIAIINTFFNYLIAAIIIIILNLFNQLEKLKDVLNCVNDYLHSADFYEQRFYTGCILYKLSVFHYPDLIVFLRFAHCKLQQQGSITSNLKKVVFCSYSKSQWGPKQHWSPLIFTVWATKLRFFKISLCVFH